VGERNNIVHLHHERISMGTQKPVTIGEGPEEIISGPVAEHHGKKKEKGKSKKGKVEAKIKEKKFAKPEEKIEAVGETKEEKSVEKVEEKPKKEKVGRSKVRSKKYKEIVKLIDRSKKYDLSEAIDLVKKTHLPRFQVMSKFTSSFWLRQANRRISGV